MFPTDQLPESNSFKGGLTNIEVRPNIDTVGSFGFEFYLEGEKIGYLTYTIPEHAITKHRAELDLTSIELTPENLTEIRGIINECDSTIKHMHVDATGRKYVYFLFNLPILNPFSYTEEAEEILDFLFPRSELKHSKCSLFCFKDGAINETAKVINISGNRATLEFNDALTDEEDLIEEVEVENLTRFWTNIVVSGDL